MDKTVSSKSKSYKILTSLYDTVTTLDTFLQSVPGLLTSEDKQSYKYLMSTTLVGRSNNAKPFPVDPSLLVTSHQSEIILRAVERIRRRDGHGKNLLTLGFNRMSDNPHAQISSSPGIEYSYPNYNTSTLLGQSWRTLLSRVGDQIMLHLLENTALFLACRRHCYVQISGTPIYELWPYMSHVNYTIPRTQKQVGTKKKRPIKSERVALKFIALKEVGINVNQNDIGAPDKTVLTDIASKDTGGEQRKEHHEISQNEVSVNVDKGSKNLATPSKVVTSGKPSVSPNVTTVRAVLHSSHVSKTPVKDEDKKNEECAQNEENKDPSPTKCEDIRGKDQKEGPKAKKHKKRKHSEAKDNKSSKKQKLDVEKESVLNGTESMDENSERIASNIKKKLSPKDIKPRISIQSRDSSNDEDEGLCYVTVMEDLDMQTTGIKTVVMDGDLNDSLYQTVLEFKEEEKIGDERSKTGESSSAKQSITEQVEATDSLRARQQSKKRRKRNRKKKQKENVKEVGIAYNFHLYADRLTMLYARDLREQFPATGLWVLAADEEDIQGLFREVFDNQAIGGTVTADTETLAKFKLKVKPLLKSMIQNHKKCPYKYLLSYYTPNTGSQNVESQNESLISSEVPVFSRGNSGTQKTLNLEKEVKKAQKKKKGVTELELLQQNLTHRQMFLFLRNVFRRVIPKELLGDKHNINIFLKHLSSFVSLGRHEKVCLGMFITGMKVGQVEWLRDVPSNLQKQHFLAKTVWWVLTQFIMPVVKTFFYMTDTSVHRNRIFYYRKRAWSSLRQKTVAAYLKKGMLKGISKEDVDERLASGRSLGVASLRFLPKAQSLRPIVNMGRTQTAAKGQSINKKLENLQQVLAEFKDQHPWSIGSAVMGTDDIYAKWRAFVDLRHITNDCRPLYFVKVDINKCYDTILQPKAFDVISKLLEQSESSEYVVRRWASVILSGEQLRRTFHRSVATLGGYQPNFKTFLSSVSKGQKMREAILIDQVMHMHEKGATLLEKLKAHLVGNIIRIGKQHYLQTVGISQGAVTSTLVCNLYYADMERVKLVGKICRGMECGCSEDVNVNFEENDKEMVSGNQDEREIGVSQTVAQQGSAGHLISVTNPYQCSEKCLPSYQTAGESQTKHDSQNPYDLHNNESRQQIKFQDQHINTTANICHENSAKGGDVSREDAASQHSSGKKKVSKVKKDSRLEKHKGSRSKTAIGNISGIGTQVDPIVFKDSDAKKITRFKLADEAQERSRMCALSQTTPTKGKRGIKRKGSIAVESAGKKQKNEEENTLQGKSQEKDAGRGKCRETDQCLKEEELLMRMVDDFLFVTPHKEHAEAFLHVMLEGIDEYNCHVNADKTVTNFAVGVQGVQEMDTDSWLPWCGLLLNTRTLEIQPDYTRYAGVSIRDTMTFDLSQHAGQALKQKLLVSMRAKCHAIFFDSKINSLSVLALNMYRTFLLGAFKFHANARCLPQPPGEKPEYFISLILSLATVFLHQIKNKLQGGCVCPLLSKEPMTWLCIQAFLLKLSLHQGGYQPIIKRLRLVLRKLVIPEPILKILKQAAKENIPPEFQLMMD